MRRFFFRTRNACRRGGHWACLAFLGLACGRSLLAEGTNKPPAATAAVSMAANPPSSPITIEQAVARAHASSPQIRALSAAVEVAKQRRSAATDIQDPEAVASWGSLGQDLIDPAVSQNGKDEEHAGARFYVPNPFLMVPRAKARSAEVMASRADLQAAQWLVESDVRRLFEELGYLAEDSALAAQFDHDSSAILDDTRARAQHGAATATDLVSATQKRLEAENNLESTRHRYQLARRDLAGLLDLPPASLQIATNGLPRLTVPDSALDLEWLQAVALHHRGDLAALHWRALAAKSAYREARNARVPWLREVTAGNRQPASDWWVAVEVTVPLFSWTKNHTENVLQAESKLAGVNETNAVQAVRRELREALEEVREQLQVQRRHQQEIAPLISQMKQAFQALKAAPNLMTAQITATEAQLVQASRLELAARWQYQLALLNLERVLGQPLSEAVPVRGGST